MHHKAALALHLLQSLHFISKVIKHMWQCWAKTSMISGEIILSLNARMEQRKYQDYYSSQPSRPSAHQDSFFLALTKASISFSLCFFSLFQNHRRHVSRIVSPFDLARYKSNLLNRSCQRRRFLFACGGFLLCAVPQVDLALLYYVMLTMGNRFSGIEAAVGPAT